MKISMPLTGIMFNPGRLIRGSITRQFPFEYRIFSLNSSPRSCVESATWSKPKDWFFLGHGATNAPRKGMRNAGRLTAARPYARFGEIA